MRSIARSGGRLVGVVALGYLLGYRPWQLHWGARPAEVLARLPGDEIVPHAPWSATRAVTVEAAPADVWPWLVQMGAGDRAGWYSYDRVDNGGRPSATRLRPELQDLAVGDRMRMTAGSDAAFEVAAIDPGRSLVLANREDGGTVTAAFVLSPAGPGRSRLVHRVRFRVRPTPAALLWAALMDAGDFVMSRRMLLGLRDRAEHRARRTRGGAEPRDDGPDRPLAFDLSVPVRRPPGEVFAVLADVQDHVGSDPRRARVRMSKQPAGATRAGTTWHEQVRVGPGWWMTVDSSATGVAEPSRLDLAFRAALFTGRLGYRVEATPEGSLLRQWETLRPRGPVRWLTRPMDARLRPRLLDRLADLRDEIERGGPPAAGTPAARAGASSV
jgi:hypothetical protein